MFNVRNILRIENFDFEDGTHEVRDKFLIIIHLNDEDAIIAPLTTSVDRVPDNLKTRRCIKEDDSNIHCYYIPKDLTICLNGFFFPKDTFIHITSANIRKRSIEHLQNKYWGSIEVKGMLTEQEYSDMLYCLYKSRHTPRGVKASIEAILTKIETKNNVE